MGEVEVEFVTKLGEEYAVPDDPLMVPATSSRWPLSELVNQLLDDDRDPTPFDFIIEGEYLRTSLAEWMHSHERTAESRLKLEYVLALGKPSTSSVDERPPWVASVAAHSSRVSAAWLDGVGRVYDGTKRVLEWKDSDAAIRCVGCVGLGDRHVVVSGAEGGEVSLAVVTRERRVVGKGAHDASVTACAVAEDGALACSGDAKGAVRLWHVEASERRAVVPQDPKLTLEGHQGQVSAAAFHGFHLLTAGVDQHVRVWDALTGSLAATWPVRVAALGFAARPDANILATSHADGGIQVWDVRREEGMFSGSALEMRGVLRTHKRLVAGVAWCPENEYWIASASHDETIKVYDVRSSTALQSVRLPAKATCVAWDGTTVVSGCADGQVRRHALNA